MSVIELLPHIARAVGRPVRCQASPGTPLLRQSRLEEVLSLLDRLGRMPRQRLSCDRYRID
jgi:hypothetical protein